MKVTNRSAPRGICDAQHMDLVTQVDRMVIVGTLKTGYPRIQALSQGKEQGVYPRAATQAVALALPPY
jgi:hypothetical protein